MSEFPPTADGSRTGSEEMLASLGSLWAAGVAVDWQAFHRSAPIRRVSLPTYPFERQSYWIGAHPDAVTPTVELRDTSKWMYKSAWAPASPLKLDTASLTGRKFVVFDASDTVGSAIVDRLRSLEATALVVRQGPGFAKVKESSYELDANDPEGYRNLAVDVCSGDERLAGVIDCWNAASPANTMLDEAAPTALLGPMRFAQALSSQQTVRPLPLLFVARGTARVDPEDALDPPRAMQAGVARVLPQEHPGLRVAHIDIDNDASVLSMIVAELAATLPEPAVAMRGGRRFVETFVPLPTSPPKDALGLPERPVVLITGGLGHMGLHLAEAMFCSIGARLVLVGRATLPQPAEWAAASQDGSVSEAQREILKRLADLRTQRDEVLVLKADLNRADEVKSAVDDAFAHFGQVDLAVHGAARIRCGCFRFGGRYGPRGDGSAVLSQDPRPLPPHVRLQRTARQNVGCCIRPCPLSLADLVWRPTQA